jgi:hypothetical protein
LAVQISVAQYECPNSGIYQGLAFKQATFDSLVGGHDNPVARTDISQPIDILSSPTEVTIVLLDACSATLSDRVGDPLTWKIGVSKKG